MVPPAICFDGRVAVVTGGGRGLGREHALLLAARGAKVLVNDLGVSMVGDGTDAAPAQSVVDEIAAAGGIALADTQSVATAQGGAAIVGRAIEEFGRIDILVNNAGMILPVPFAEMTPAQFDATVDVNFRGAFNVTWPAWRAMREQGYGRIVMTSSNSGWIGSSNGLAHYGACKLGVVGFAKCLAAETKGLDIRVNAITPRAGTRIRPELPPARLVSPLVAWLAHERCTVSGELFDASGGRVSRVFFGLTPGFADHDLSPESIDANITAIMAGDCYIVPRTSREEIEHMLMHLPPEERR